MSFTITDKDEGSLEFNDRVLLVGDLNDGASARLIRYLWEKELQVKKPDHVDLIINSCGGYVNDTLAIIDVINSISFPVHTYGLGQVYSAALFLFMSGAKGHRYLFPNASVLSHQWAGGTGGKQHEIEATEKENKLLSERILKHYILCTGLSKEQILTDLLPASDVYLSAKESIKYGLADSIVKKI